MLFLLFIYFSFSANEFPIIPESYIKGYFPPDGDTVESACNNPNTNFSYDTYTFQCKYLDPEKNYHPSYLYDINETGFTNLGLIGTVNCSNDTNQVLNACIPKSYSLKYQPSICDSVYPRNEHSDCKNLLSLYQITFLMPAHQQAHPQALQFLINHLVLQDYIPMSTEPYNTLVSPELGLEGYINWPQHLPFYSYLTLQASISSILEENYITSRYRFAQVSQFYLARYKWNGEFIGFTPLTFELNKCGQKNDISQIWRRFGTSLKLECFFDLTRDVNESSNEFYEIFISDGRNSKGVIMRPIPVSFNGVPCRRFYKFNNLTNFIKFIDSTKIDFQQLTSEKSYSTIRTPYFTFTTRNVQAESINQLNSGVRFKSDSDQHPEFKFEVNYSMNLNNLQQIYTYLAIALGIAFFAIMLARIIIVILFEGKSSLNTPCCMNIFSIIFETIGGFFFLMTFGFSIIILIFYKWQKEIFWFYPPNNFKLFKISQVFMYISLITIFIGIIFRVFFQQLFNNFIIMDWEMPIAGRTSVSAWRRINLSNELNRLVTIRSYSVSFTIIAVVFVLNGFKVENLSSPIPSTRLIDIGYDHWVLRFGISSFLWIVLMAIQYIWFHYIYWQFYGNPYFNFLDLCTVSNLSLFISTSSFHGYYLHGRSVHSHCDVDMKKLSQALVDEKEGLVGLRGLDPNTPDQVFEVFFSRDFSLQLYEKLEEIRIQFMHVKIRMTADEISVESLKMYDSLNKFLKMFIEGTNENRYSVQPPEISQIIFKVPFQMNNDSIMNKVKDIIYKRSLLAGAEWILMLMYLLLFCTIDCNTSSPGIAGFVVYIVDWVIVTIYQRLFRLRLAKTSLLDSRFLLT